jgi:hypothetical protein
MRKSKKTQTVVNRGGVFWWRLAGFIIFTFALPVIAISWRFGLFENRDASVRLTGWGILAVLFISLGLFSLIKRYTKDLPHSGLKQFVDTLLYVIGPLAFATTILFLIKDVFEEVYFVVRFMLIFMPIGALLNPLPGWVQKLKDDHQRDIIHNP